MAKKSEHFVAMRLPEDFIALLAASLDLGKIANQTAFVPSNAFDRMSLADVFPVFPRQILGTLITATTGSYLLRSCPAFQSFRTRT